MPTFTDPFVQNVPERKMTNAELIRAIRINMAAELDATSLYEAHAEATDHPLAKKVLIDIANEERVHVGEFMELLKILQADEEGWLTNGANEVREMQEEVEAGDYGVPTPEEKAEAEGILENKEESEPLFTIGSLK